MIMIELWKGNSKVVIEADNEVALRCFKKKGYGPRVEKPKPLFKPKEK